MDDVHSVRGGQCGRNLSGDAQRGLYRKLMFPSEPGTQRLSFEKFHRQIGHTRFGKATVEDANDSGMIHRVGCARFIEKACGHVGATRHIGTQNLDRSATQHAFVNGLEHHSHAATTEHTQKPMAADLLSDPRLWLFGLHDTSPRKLDAPAH